MIKTRKKDEAMLPDGTVPAGPAAAVDLPTTPAANAQESDPLDELPGLAQSISSLRQPVQEQKKPKKPSP